MLLIHNDQSVYESWSEAERQALFAEVDTITTELKESGELVGGGALADQSLTKTVRARSRRRMALSPRPRNSSPGILPSTARPPSAPSRSPPAGQTPSTSRWRSGCSRIHPGTKPDCVIRLANLAEQESPGREGPSDPPRPGDREARYARRAYRPLMISVSAGRLSSPVTRYDKPNSSCRALRSARI
jgi:hypothetical protein